ncbi:MAG: HD-like signal output (HDOD) protein [Cognaticolwellia sp.]|jgi:HD-like signal output (HDOD) protein
MAVAYAVKNTMTETLVELRSALADPNYRPPMLPRAAMDVMRLSRHPGLDLSRLALVLEQDPLLAAAVLRVAQSPVYSRRWEPRSVREALGRLGIQGMRAVVVEAAVNVIPFPSSCWQKQANQVRRRCVAMGHVSRAIALLPGTGVDPEEAFLAGLLADLGKLAVLGLIAERGMTMERSGSQAVLEALHTGAVALLAQYWHLPDSVREVLVSHHSLALLGDLGRVACVVRVSETLVDLAEDRGRWLPAELHETGYLRALFGCGIKNVPIIELHALARDTLGLLA